MEAVLAFVSKILCGRLGWFLALISLVRIDAGQLGPPLKLTVTWGHRAPQMGAYYLRFGASDARIADFKLEGGEGTDSAVKNTVRGEAGGGDVDGVSCTLNFEEQTIHPITNAQQIWKYLLAEGDRGAAERLKADPAWRPDTRKLTFFLNETGTRGFTLTIDQLLSQKNFWFPELDLYLSAGESPSTFRSYEQTLAAAANQRVLDRTRIEPEASYSEYKGRWEDMGQPVYSNPHSIPPGHIVGLAWDSALYKFGIDRYAGVRNDYSKIDSFELQFVLRERAQAWRNQNLHEGLPLVTTIFEEDGIRYGIEQFAFPLLGPPIERRGDIPMVLFEKVTILETEGRARPLSVRMQLSRELTNSIEMRKEAGMYVLGTDENAWLGLRGDGLLVTTATEKKRHEIQVELELPEHGTRSFVVTLPSPLVSSRDHATFLALNYEEARGQTIRFWEDYLARGASFHVPEEAVNTLFRANLWHALRLPRRHGGAEPDVKIDLPYSNFAYDQKGTPWPVNQSVYVDYMIYDLRGYHNIAAEELAAMYRNNQEPNGHVGGFANWGVYTPSMLYSVAQHFLLSGDRQSFERLLPATLLALDWCLAEAKHADDPKNPTPGLIFAPLNDLTHDARSWAFNQAYFVAGFDLLGRALAAVHHPRAAECREAAAKMSMAVEREFAKASVRSPAVQLADSTWSPYVPTDAQASGRMFQVWYPTDVDVGPLHLIRLRAMDPKSLLSSAMLNDHEDNLFLRQWGAINEPVYNMQGTAYLLRDEPKAAIRTFYSTMACAFSHTVFEPVEHRWAWGQYFGPPSTDGSWFELYRNMLLREEEGEALLICQAAPRAWFGKDKLIEVRRAPTYFGPVSFKMEAATKSMTARVDLPESRRPAAVLIRFRHPEAKPIRAVSVNGENWTDFDVGKEWVRIPRPTQASYSIVTQY